MKRPIKSTIMVFVQDIITDKMGYYNHFSTIKREIILCGIEIVKKSAVPNTP